MKKTMSAATTTAALAAIVLLAAQGQFLGTGLYRHWSDLHGFWSANQQAIHLQGQRPCLAGPVANLPAGGGDYPFYTTVLSVP